MLNPFFPKIPSFSAIEFKTGYQVPLPVHKGQKLCVLLALPQLVFSFSLSFLFYYLNNSEKLEPHDSEIKK